jgi:hypothetical protein
MLPPATGENDTPLQAARHRHEAATRRLRDTTAATGTEAAGDELELDLGVAWDIGAPLPHQLASEGRTFLIFYLRDPVPGWNSTWVQVVNPAAEHEVPGASPSSSTSRP